jgi:hypothetical protein
MTERALKSAVGALKLKDIVLHEARFRRPSDMEQETPVQELVKRAVEFKRVPQTSQTVECLRILVGLGIRYTAISDGSKAPIYLEIEADFVAQYEVTASITEDAIRAFAAFNAVHNVWPFWRQHVYDIVNRGRLRPIDIPLYSGNPVGGVAVSEASPGHLPIDSHKKVKPSKRSAAQARRKRRK